MKGRKANLKAVTSLLSLSMTTFTSCNTIGSCWVCEDPEMPTGLPVTAGNYNALAHASLNKKQPSGCFLLTHRGSNPDSSEPKSDVLPITPWVNRRLIRRGKSRNFFYFRIALSRKR